jgi:ubiquinone/menaquinone biosynthesis C-methylase UbiE
VEQPSFKPGEAASYDRVAQDYGIYIERLAGPLADHICNLARIAPGTRVLDVGCGTGLATGRAALRTGAAGQAIGVDLSPGMIDVARRASPNAEFAVMDAEHLDLEASSFDCVISLCAVTHFPSLEQALAEMRRVLRPGGTLTVAFGSPRPASLLPLMRHLFHRALRARSEWRAPGALRETARDLLPEPPETERVLAKWTLRQPRRRLRQELERAGFEGIDVSWLGHDVRFTSPQEFTDAQLAIDTCVRKHADSVSESARGELREALVQRSERALRDGKALVYPYAAVFFAARRPPAR